MTPLEKWNADPSNAVALKKLLEDPILSFALNVIQGKTMARTVGQHQLIALGDKATSLFGYDVGRESVFLDLEQMTKVEEALEIPEPSYTDEQRPSNL